MNTTEARVPAVTRREAHVLVRALDALNAIEKRTRDYGRRNAEQGYHFGMVSGTANVASDAVFAVLNHAISYLDGDDARAADAALKRWLR